MSDYQEDGDVEPAFVLLFSINMKDAFKGFSALTTGISPRKLYSENEQKRRLGLPMKNKDKKKRFFSKEMTEINDEAIKDLSIVALGADNPLIEKLFEKTASTKDSGSPLSVDIKKNPRNPEKVVAIINVSERQKTAAAFKEIFEYPFYSSYSLKDGQVIKKLHEMPRGIRLKLNYGTIP